MGKAGTKEGKKAGDTRLVATLLLQEILEEGRLSHLAIRETLDAQEGWSRQERAFFTRLVEGSLERRITLDAVIDSYSRVPLARLKPFIRSLLRISLYQILYMESVPDSAACAEAVKLTQKRGLSGLKAFVNGLLRTVVREREAILLEIQTQAGVRGLSVRYSLPEWLITHFLSLYPEETVERMAAAFLEENR